jgi:hypothetical protein
MSDNLKAVRCPSCGAPLDIPHKHERFFKCGFCGTAIEDDATDEEQDTGLFKLHINPHVEPTVTYAQLDLSTAKIAGATAATAGAGASIGGACLTIFIVAITLGILTVALFPVFANTGALAQLTEALGLSDEVSLVDSTGLGGRNIFHFSPVTVVASDNDSQQDVILVARLSDDSERLIYLDFEAEVTARWLSEPLPDGATYTFNVLIADSERVFLTIESDIFAFSRSDGSQVWQASLSDELQASICQDCVQRLGNLVVVLTADGNLQAFEAATGSQSWAHLFNETPRQIVNFGGNPAVLDDIDEQVSLQVFDVSSGQLTQDVRAECPSDPFPDNPQTPAIYDTIFGTGNGEQIYFAIEQFGPACVQRWDGTTGEMVWQSTFLEDALREKDPENILISEDYFFMGNRTGLYSLDLLTGTYQPVILVEDFEYFPLAYRDGILIVRADLTRGTRRSQVWGVNVETGESLWAVFLTAEEPADDLLGSLVLDRGVWAAGLTPNGVTIIEAFDGPNRLLFQTAPFQPATEPSNVFQLDLPDEIGSMRFSILDWQADQVWITIDGRVAVYDVYTGDLQTQWP